MKRVFWGLVKIGIIIGLLVWIAQEFFPVSTNQEKAQVDTTTEKLIEETEVSIEKETIKTPLAARNIEPTTPQQKQYALYNEKAGTSEVFTAELALKGTVPISTQLARAFGEPRGEWGNFAAHSKTFWVLAELTLLDIDVDAARSLDGAVLTVKTGNVTIDLSETSVTSFSVSTFVVSNVSFASSSVDASKIEGPLPTKKTMRRMSGRNWQQVLEAGTRRGVLEKREI